jgi:hypothetical protein
VKLTTKKRKGGGKVFKVECADPDGNIITYCTKEDVKAVAGQTIDERYPLAYSAPIKHHTHNFWQILASWEIETQLSRS